MNQTFSSYFDGDPTFEGFNFTLGCFFFANLAFWSSSLICTMMDHTDKSSTVGKFLMSYKTQGLKSYFTPQDLKDAYKQAAINMLFVSPLTLVPTHLLHNVISRSGLPTYKQGRMNLDNSWDIYRELWVLVGCAFVIDFWFYWTHRAMHSPSLYKAIHKMHHRFKAPQAVAAVYAHPVEFVVGNMMGVALGPILMNAHPYTAYAWFIIALCSTCGAHSGYHFLQAEKHDDHHKYFNYNFGVGPICDVLFGTMLPEHMKVDDSNTAKNK